MKNSTKTRQEWILDELKKIPDLTYSEVFGKYSVNFGKSNRTFDKDWRIAQEKFTEYRSIVNREKAEITAKEEAKGILKAISTKEERLQSLQEMIDIAKEELRTGTHNETVKSKDVEVNYTRLLTPTEKARARNTILNLQAEMSKIEGDYAPKRLDHTTDGQSFNTADLSKLTDEEREMLNKIYDKLCR